MNLSNGLRVRIGILTLSTERDYSATVPVTTQQLSSPRLALTHTASKTVIDTGGGGVSEGQGACLGLTDNPETLH